MQSDALIKRLFLRGLVGECSSIKEPNLGAVCRGSDNDASPYGVDPAFAQVSVHSHLHIAGQAGLASAKEVNNFCARACDTSELGIETWQKLTAFLVSTGVWNSVPVEF